MLYGKPYTGHDYDGPYVSSAETLTTWADGFGVWHARVSFPGLGYGPAYLDQHIGRIRARARRAIRREILAREAGPIGPVRVRVVANELDHMNVTRSITYAEAPTSTN